VLNFRKRSTKRLQENPLLTVPECLYSID